MVLNAQQVTFRTFQKPAHMSPSAHDRKKNDVIPLKFIWLLHFSGEYEIMLAFELYIYIVLLPRVSAFKQLSPKKRSKQQPSCETSENGFYKRRILKSSIRNIIYLKDWTRFSSETVARER